MVSANINDIKQQMEDVLILIILEDGFCLKKIKFLVSFWNGLNPYYTGRWFLLVLAGWK